MSDSPAVVLPRSVEADLERRRGSPVRAFLRICRQNPVAVVAGLFLLAEAVIAISAGVISDVSPQKTALLSRLHGPSSDHWFGTDSVGRDQFVRVLYGTQASLWIALLATLGGVVPGTLIGLVTGYFGGWIDLILQRFIDTLQAFPALIMGMLIVSIAGPGTELDHIPVGIPGLVHLFSIPIPSVNVVVFPIALIFLPSVSRVVRASTLTLRDRDFILACHTIGASPARIMLRHMLPNVFSAVLVVTSLLFGAAIIVEASLSFLGLGVQAPFPSLGGILSQEGRPQLALHPYLAVIPALVISMTVLCVNIVGDTLRDVLDPSLRGRL